MTREEFLPAYQRLCRGHRFHATDEKAEATFQAVARWPLAAWEKAADLLLLEPRMPARERLFSALEQSAEEIRRASFVPYGLPNQIPEGAPNREYGQARLDLIKARSSGKIDDQGLADALFDLIDRFPEHDRVLVSEAVAYRNRHQERMAAREATRNPTAGVPQEQPTAATEPAQVDDSDPARPEVPAPPETPALEPLRDSGLGTQVDLRLVNSLPAEPTP